MLHVKGQRFPLRLFNTLSRSKEDFSPLDLSEVKLYTCGPTVYDYLTIGNLRAYVFADTLKRVLLYNGLSVNHVENITDVGHLTNDSDTGDDKLSKKAAETGKNAWEIAKFFTAIFMNDIAKLNILPPTTWATATEHIDEQIAFVKNLEEKGYTYTTSDGVYFDTSKLEDYGELAGLDAESLAAQREGARVDKNEERRNPTDFALWKFAKAGEKRDMEWSSPWGEHSFPGWHIECSAMGTKYLGEHIDIHTGGIDHVPIHHTNEIAQNKARFGHRVVSTWMHNEFLQVDGTRIGKSEGNAITLAEIEKKGFNPLSYRYYLLTSHYRSQISFSWDAIEAADTAYRKLVRIASDLKLHASEAHNIGTSIPDVQQQFLEAVNDDLNTAKGIAIVWDMLKSNSFSDPDKKATLLHVDAVLGLNLEQQALEFSDSSLAIPIEVQTLIDEREQARLEKDFTEADALRDKINALGYFLEDTDSGIRAVRK